MQKVQLTQVVPKTGRTTYSIHPGLCFIIILDFVNCALEVIQMSPEQRNSMRDAARRSVDRFTEANFEKNWNSAIAKLLPACQG